MFCFIFSQGGNVGIGTVNPTATLHVSTNNEYVIRMEDAVDTSSGSYTIQSSDNLGTFVKIPTDVFKKVQIATLPSSGSIVSQPDNSWQTTAISISLPPGKWQITGALVIRPSVNLSTDSSIVLKSKLSVADTSSSITPSNDIITDSTFGQGYFLGSYYAPEEYGIMKGNIYINNITGSTKTYFFIANINRINTTTVNFTNFGASSELENQIFALPAF